MRTPLLLAFAAAVVVFGVAYFGEFLLLLVASRGAASMGPAGSPPPAIYTLAAAMPRSDRCEAASKHHVALTRGMWRGHAWRVAGREAEGCPSGGAPHPDPLVGEGQLVRRADTLMFFSWGGVARGAAPLAIGVLAGDTLRVVPQPTGATGDEAHLYLRRPDG